MFVANVHNLDDATGRLLDAVAEMGLRENTVVVFTSDKVDLAKKQPQELKRLKKLLQQNYTQLMNDSYAWKAGE